MRKDHRAQVLHNARETQAYWRLRVRLPESFPIRPGQFVMVRARDQREPLWRRALVIYRAQEHTEGMDLEFLYKVLGRGTLLLSRQRPGDELDVLGPLGNGFPIHANAEAILVSGGIGLPTLFLLAETLARAPVRIRLFHGEATLDPQEGLPALSDFARVLGPQALTLATEDGSAGFKGRVTEALEAFLERSRPRGATLYACGPWPMLRRVAQIAARFDLPAYVALEARMACGFGVCLGCAVKIRTPSDPIPHYRRVCVEGPIFRAEEVVWDDV